MKKTIFLLAISIGFMLTSACKKEKKEESTPTPTTPTPTNTTVELSLVEFTDYTGTITAPSLVAVSPAGDTISIQAMNVMGTYANGTSVNDSTTCAIPLSCTVTYPMLADGTHYTVYFKEGATVKGSIGVTYGDVISLSGCGYAKMCPSNYHRVVVGW